MNFNGIGNVLLRTFGPVLLISLMIVSAAGIFSTPLHNTSLEVNRSAALLDQQIENLQIPVIKIQPDIPINIIFLGTNQSYIDQQRIDNNITKFYVPTISMKNLLFYNVNYTLNTHYYYSSQQMELDYVNYINSIAYTDVSPSYLTDYYDPAATNSLFIDASDTLTWLDDHVNSYFNTDINSSYTFYIIDTYTDGYISDYYYYHTDIYDADTGLQSQDNYTNYYGGDYPSRGVFLDLSAGPVFYHPTYHDSNINDDGVSPLTIIPMWGYNLQSTSFMAKFADQMNEYIQETIDLVFLPSYLYIPEIRPNFDIEIVLFDDAGTSLASWIDIQAIADSFGWLLPYYNITVTLQQTHIANHPDLQQVITTNSQDDGSGNTVITTEPVVEYLKNHQSEFGFDDNAFPVYIFGTSASQWFTGVGILGVGQDDGFGNPEMVIMGYPFYAGNPWEEYTSTIIHEVGHLTSLRHPHDGFSWDRYNDTNGNYSIVDWLPDFISTPMTYANPDASFSTFDADQLDRGYALNRINATWYDLAQANVTLLNKDYSNLNQTSDTLISSLQDCLDMMHAASDSFKQLDFFDAFDLANQSYFQALDYLSAVSALETYVAPTTSSSSSSSSSTLSSNSIASETGSSTGLSLPISLVPVLLVLIALPITRNKFKK